MRKPLIVLSSLWLMLTASTAAAQVIAGTFAMDKAQMP
jgi:hypothetical protein